MMEPIYRQETDAVRALVQGGAVHIQDKSNGSILTYRMTEDRQKVLRGEDWEKPAAEIEHDSFEELWEQAEQAGAIFVEKVISGGQAGADRGGLDAAMALNDHRKENGGKLYEIGGWCPFGRRAEDGEIPEVYPLMQTRSKSYKVRTRHNIDDADATIIFVDGGMSGGSLDTVEYCKKRGKLHLALDLITYRVDKKTMDRTSFEIDSMSWLLKAGRIRNWLAAGKVKTLNIAGSRESKAPGIQNRVGRFMVDVLR